MTNYAIGGVYEASEELYKFNDERFRLKAQLERAMNALEFYANEAHYRKECWDLRVGAVEEVIIDNGRIARGVLKEFGL